MKVSPRRGRGERDGQLWVSDFRFRPSAAGRGLLTNKANLEAGKSAASDASTAACRPAGGRLLPRTNPFGGRRRDRSPSYCPVPDACCLSGSRCSRLKTAKALCPKDLRISGRSGNVAKRSVSFRNFPFRSALFRPDASGFQVVARRRPAGRWAKRFSKATGRRYTRRR